MRSVASKSKKLYIAYDVIPAKEITGGPWYSDQEFDYEFVQELGNCIVKIIGKAGIADIQMIADQVRKSGVSKV